MRFKLFLLLMYGVSVCKLSAQTQQLTPVAPVAPADTSKYPNPFLSAFPEKEPQPINLIEFQKSLKYPKLLRKAGLMGKVYVRCLIDTNGNIIKHIILKATHPAFTNEIEGKLQNLKFIPGSTNGKPTLVWVTVPFYFSLY